MGTVFPQPTAHTRRKSLIPSPAPINLTDLEAGEEDARVMYGLPRYVHFCKRCV